MSSEHRQHRTTEANTAFTAVDAGVVVPTNALSGPTVAPRNGHRALRVAVAIFAPFPAIIHLARALARLFVAVGSVLDSRQVAVARFAATLWRAVETVITFVTVQTCG